MGAVRGGRDDALAQRHAVDADIEEAADDRAENKEHSRPEMERNALPIASIKDLINHRRFARGRGA